MWVKHYTECGLGHIPVTNSMLSANKKKQATNTVVCFRFDTTILLYFPAFLLQQIHREGKGLFLRMFIRKIETR